MSSPREVSREQRSHTSPEIAENDEFRQNCEGPSQPSHSTSAPRDAANGENQADDQGQRRRRAITVDTRHMGAYGSSAPQTTGSIGTNGRYPKNIGRRSSASLKHTPSSGVLKELEGMYQGMSVSALTEAVLGDTGSSDQAKSNLQPRGSDELQPRGRRALSSALAPPRMSVAGSELRKGDAMRALPRLPDIHGHARQSSQRPTSTDSTDNNHGSTSNASVSRASNDSTPTITPKGTNGETPQDAGSSMTSVDASGYGIEAMLSSGPMFDEGKKSGLTTSRFLVFIASLNIPSHLGLHTDRNGKVLCPIHPSSLFRVLWDLGTVLISLFIAVELPFRLAFMPELFEQWSGLDLALDCLFLVDIVLNFLTGILNQRTDSIEMRMAAVARTYFRGWFAADLIASLPLDPILDAIFNAVNSQSSESSNILRLNRLIKLFRFTRLVRIMRLFRMKRGATRIFKKFDFQPSPLKSAVALFVATTAMYLHWSACAQFAVALPNETDLVPSPEVIAELVLNKRADLLSPDQPLLMMAVGDSTGLHYTMAFYSAVNHFVANAIYDPMTVAEVVVTTISMLCGAALFSILLGTMASLLLQLSAHEVELLSWQRQLDSYLRAKRAPSELIRRVSQYVNRQREERVFHENRLLSRLNLALKRDVMFFLRKSLIKNTPFFVDAEEAFLDWVVTSLTPQHFGEGEDVVREGESIRVNPCMYLISSGQMQVIKDGQLITTLKEGAHFGEMALLTQELKDVRTATVRAAVPSDVYALSRKDLLEMLEAFPEVKRRMELMMNVRHRANKKLEAQRKHKTASFVRRDSLRRSSDTGFPSAESMVLQQTSPKAMRLESFSGNTRDTSAFNRDSSDSEDSFKALQINIKKRRGSVLSVA